MGTQSIIGEYNLPIVKAADSLITDVAVKTLRSITHDTEKVPLSRLHQANRLYLLLDRVSCMDECDVRTTREEIISNAILDYECL